MDIGRHEPMAGKKKTLHPCGDLIHPYLVVIDPYSRSWDMSFILGFPNDALGRRPELDSDHLRLQV